MKTLIVGIAALGALMLPSAAFSKFDDPGVSAGNPPASAQEAPPAQAPNFSVTGDGTATSCGTGCTAASGTYRGTLAGSFTARVVADYARADSGGCAPAQGTITLNRGSDSVEQGVSGTVCGARFSGSYTVTDGTGAFQNDGQGYGAVSYTAAGAFHMSSSGTFNPTEPRQGG